MKYVSLAFLFLFFVLFIACEDDSLTSTETEYTYVTDTIIVNVVDTLQNTVVETRTDTIVLENDRHVVEYDTIAIDQECTQKDVNGAVTISCGSKDVTVNKATCDTTGFDPAKNFCYDGKIMDFCDGYAYNPEKYFCQNDSVIAKCKGETFDVTKKFCIADTLFNLCQGKKYNTNQHFCQNDSLIKLCGKKAYDVEKEYCENGSIFVLCKGEKYDQTRKFCYDDSLWTKCNGEIYNPGNEFCYDEKVFDLCNGKEYHALDYFCHDDYLVNYCEGHEFDPSKKFCYNDSLIDQQDCPTTLKNNGCGYFADERDSLMYKYVVIGEQTWMAQNLNYAYIQPTSRLDSSSFCYWTTTSRQEDYYSGSIKQQSATLENGTCPKYGRLYMWSAAMDSAAVFSEDGKGCGYLENCNNRENIRGVCPEGWHLPSQSEWNALYSNVGGVSKAGTALKSTQGWNNDGEGEDSYGFSVLSAGYFTFALGSIHRDGLGFEGGFWYSKWSASTASGPASYVYFRFDLTNATQSNYAKDSGRSIRCIKD